MSNEDLLTGQSSLGLMLVSATPSRCGSWKYSGFTAKETAADTKAVVRVVSECVVSMCCWNTSQYVVGGNVQSGRVHVKHGMEVTWYLFQCIANSCLSLKYNILQAGLGLDLVLRHPLEVETAR